MYCEPETSLMARMRDCGLLRKDVCQALRKPYGTVAGWLNGFCPLPPQARKSIENLITERVEAKKAIGLTVETWMGKEISKTDAKAKIEGLLS